MQKFKAKIYSIFSALKSPNTYKVLVQIIKEIPRVKKNIYRIRKYGIKHIFKYIVYEIFGRHLIKNYYSKKNVIKVIDNKNKFKKVTIDTTYFNTDLCEIGKKYNSDKSPHAPNKHRHAYTGIYHFLFHNIRNEKINVGEIGIYENNGIKMFREYFKNANLYGYENNLKLIEDAKNDNLHNTKYFYMEVNDPISINDGLKKCEDKFDIIIDDSSHMFQHQINIVKNSVPYLKKGGYLIVEDVFNNIKIHDERNYYKELNNIKDNFSEIYFVQSEHVNRYSPMFDNDKLLVLIKA